MVQYVFLCENKTNHIKKSYCLGKKHITLNETIYFFNAILGQQQLRTAVNAPAAGKHYEIIKLQELVHIINK